MTPLCPRERLHLNERPVERNAGDAMGDRKWVMKVQSDYSCFLGPCSR